MMIEKSSTGNTEAVALDDSAIDAVVGGGKPKQIPIPMYHYENPETGSEKREKHGTLNP